MPAPDHFNGFFHNFISSFCIGAGANAYTASRKCSAAERNAYAMFTKAPVAAHRVIPS